jgi:hypothetical protein
MIEATAEHLTQPGNLTTLTAIDQYSDYLVEFTQGLIEKSVPWGKPSSYGQPWWTEEVQEIVQRERAARRKGE